MVLVTLAAVVLIYLAAKAQTIKVTTSHEGMVGEAGRVEKKLEHDEYLVRVHGEYWRAESFDKLEPGDKVTVTAIRNLMIQVEKVK